MHVSFTSILIAVWRQLNVQYLWRSLKPGQYKRVTFDLCEWTLRLMKLWDVSQMQRCRRILVFFVFFVKTEAHIFFKVDGQKLKGKDGIKDSCCCCCCCSLHLPPPAHHKALNPSLDCHCSDPPTLYVANTQLSERWTPDRWSTHRQRLLHHRRTDKHWKRVFFFFFFSGLLLSTARKLHFPFH